MNNDQPAKASPGQIIAVLASHYPYNQLAELYNQTRIDYIVPMPMNAVRMADYVQQYDIDLGASTVALGNDELPLGVVMLGLREQRSWITRLGLLPEQRGRKIGQFLMELSLEKSRQRQVNRVQLEVIQGNEPAYQLFKKLGFVEVGELLVIRRPPGLPTELDPGRAEIVALDAEGIRNCLTQREENIAWTEETPSLLHLRTLKGIFGTLPSGEQGWLIYEFAPFQLTHIVLDPGTSEELALVLLYHLHKQHPMHDTKIENIRAGHPALLALARLGYVEAFRRIEMYLYL